jgi:hypothetical protein
MASSIKSLRTAGHSVSAPLLTFGLVLFAQYAYLYGQDKSGFPDGHDAVQAAPASHRVVFENAFIRVVYVTLPPAGSSEPMHTHRWPSVFLGYDTGGKTAHIRYHTPDGRVRDIPSQTEPVHPGTWGSGQWKAPEPMHSIEVVENPAPGPGGFPGWLRIEVKCASK